MRFKYINCSYHFLEIYYRRLNLNILKLAQLLIDGNIDSGSGPTKMIVSLHVDVQKMCLKEH